MNFILKYMVQSERQKFQAQCAGRNQNPSAPGVKTSWDVPWGEVKDPAHTMDVYVPDPLPASAPVIVNIHGGGLMMGNKAFNRPFCLDLCRQGYVVFALEYPLCPEATVPEQLGIIAAALDHIHGLLPRYGADPTRVYLVADSAGALLSLWTAAMQGSPALAQAAGIHPGTLPIRAMALISGMFYTTQKDAIGLLLPTVFYGKGYKKSPFYPYINPEHPEITKHLPPMLLTTSTGDNLRHYTVKFAAALQEAGATFTLKNYGNNPQLTHAFPVFSPDLPETKQVVGDIAAYFGSH